MKRIYSGIECLTQSPPKKWNGHRLGLLCNPASINANFIHSSVLLDRCYPGQVRALFSPQHGYLAEKQDNMIESSNTADPVLHVPVFSLYGETRIPTQEMFDLIDILFVDLQDVGTRVYTFMYTVSYCLEAAKKLNKKIIILDRPNPINGIDIEGNCLKSNCASFVGRYPIPMRHGLTLGELALLFNEYFNIGCDLEIVLMKGWQRHMFFEDTGLPWVPPSPNIPSPKMCFFYPGQVLLEGTNISEGRGTSQPFEIFGAPYIRPEHSVSLLTPYPLPGIVLRPLGFEPTSNKWQGQLCKGFQIHVTDISQYRPYSTTLKLLSAIYADAPNAFSWKSPPYEYEHTRLPFDLISGDTAIREAIENHKNMDTVIDSWQDELNAYHQIAMSFYLY
ncbi:MAG: DUF1343 domain-containing protein [Desulfobacterales bacterium]|nr:DUF1343 domain-containing protein [Desulfobacterales bacterium]